MSPHADMYICEGRLSIATEYPQQVTFVILPRPQPYTFPNYRAPTLLLCTPEILYVNLRIGIAFRKGYVASSVTNPMTTLATLIVGRPA